MDERESNPEAAEALKLKMIRIAHMFEPHQDAPLMRQLCRIAIKCLEEEGAARD